MKYFNLYLKFNIIFALVLTLFSCASDKELIRFESGGNYLTFTNKDVSGVSLDNDAGGKIYANLTLSDRGQQLLTEFTSNHINRSLTVTSNGKILMKDLPIRDKITMKSILFSFKSDQEAKDFVSMIEGGL